MAGWKSCCEQNRSIIFTSYFMFTAAWGLEQMRPELWDALDTLAISATDNQVQSRAEESSCWPLAPSCLPSKSPRSPVEYCTDLHISHWSLTAACQLRLDQVQMKHKNLEQHKLMWTMKECNNIFINTAPKQKYSLIIVRGRGGGGLCRAEEYGRTWDPHSLTWHVTPSNLREFCSMFFAFLFIK